jgi:hypothetical protein
MSHCRNFRRRRLPPERSRISLFGRHGSPSWPWRMLLREPTAGVSFGPLGGRAPRHSIRLRVANRPTLRPRPQILSSQF